VNDREYLRLQVQQRTVQVRACQVGYTEVPYVDAILVLIPGTVSRTLFLVCIL
jgi:hypothetical protein